MSWLIFKRVVGKFELVGLFGWVVGKLVGWLVGLGVVVCVRVRGWLCGCLVGWLVVLPIGRLCVFVCLLAGLLVCLRVCVFV